MNPIFVGCCGILVMAGISVVYFVDIESISNINLPQVLIGKDCTNNNETFDNYEKTKIEHMHQASVRLRTFQAMNDNTNPYTFYNALAIEAICPSKLRVGLVGDGGKWVCNPWRLPDNCTIYSLGINGQIDFEADMQELTQNRCKVYGYDLAEQTDFIRRKYKNFNGELKAGRIVASNELEGLSAEPKISIVKEIDGRKNKTIDIFKIDIEGSEARVLPELVKFYQPCQILVETHSDASPTYQLLKALSAAGYWLFSFEINAWGFQYCEYSFIHETCFAQYEIFPLAKIFS